MKILLLHLCSFFIFSTATIYITYPLIFHMTTMATGLGDELVIAWIQNWVIHALATNPLGLFQADIYYPFHNSLAFADIFLSTSILSAIPLWIFKEPIITVNFTLISSFIFLGFCTYLLSYSLTKNFWASVLSGILVIFAPTTIDKHMHLQVVAIEGVPLALLFFFNFLKTARVRMFIVSLCVFVIQTYNSFLPGYFIVFSYAIAFAVYLLFYRTQARALITKKNIVLFLLACILIVPITIPYFTVSKEFSYTRDIRDTIHFALQPEDFLYPGSATRLAPLLLQVFPAKNYPKNAEFKPGYLGAVFTVLSILTVLYALRKRKKGRTNWIFFVCLVCALTGLILSLGPALHINRLTIHHPFPILLPYGLFYYLIPGFQGFRNTARWEMLFVIFMAVGIAIASIQVLKKYTVFIRTTVFIFLIVGVVGEYNFPMYLVKIPQIKDFPKEYAWLKTTPADTKIIEMPVYNWDIQPYSYGELVRGYYNTSYFRTTVSGFSGFSPPPWQSMVKHLLAEFPSDQTIQELHQLGITYILVHTNEYDQIHSDHLVVNGHGIPDGSHVIDMLRENKRVRLIKIFQSTYIYQLL